MTLFYRLVLNSVCRSNHHRLAVMALAHLTDAEAPQWRNLFLHHYATYLDGAKAPDEVFKDFKNHVLHVREGDWGGAPRAAREWYRRTVRALQAGDWKMAAWNAGVMSHYVVDPIQPFHTGQTEEEGVIHRAVEWSLSKGFEQLKDILDTDPDGYPYLAAPEGDDWLEAMIRTGAVHANAYYETLIDHYDFRAGAKDPLAGPDAAMKEAVAHLLGYATVLLARVMDRALAEAGVRAPRVNLVLDTLFAGMTTPIRALLKFIDDEKERELVERQYAEFVKTGKVRRTLSEDDRTIRELHAAEVLKVPLSSLDCQWPREIGTAVGAPLDEAPEPHPDAIAVIAPPAPAPVAQEVMVEAAVEDAPRKPARKKKKRARDADAEAVASGDAADLPVADEADADDDQIEELVPAAPRAPAIVIRPQVRMETAETAPVAVIAADVEAGEAAEAVSSKDLQGLQDTLATAFGAREADTRDAPEPVAAEALDDDADLAGDSDDEIEPAPTPAPVRIAVPAMEPVASAASDAAKPDDAGVDDEDDDTPRERDAGRGLRIRLTRSAPVVDAPSIGPKTADRLHAIGVNTVGDLLELRPEDAAAAIHASHINAGKIRDWQSQARLACALPELTGGQAQALVAAGVSDLEDLAAAEPSELIDMITEFAASEEGERVLREGAIPDEARVGRWIAAAQELCAERDAA